MSDLHEKVSLLFSHHSDKKPLHNYYSNRSIGILSRIKNPHKNSFLLLQSLGVHFQQTCNETSSSIFKVFNNTDEKTPILDDKFTEQTKNNSSRGVLQEILLKLFKYKSFHLRALILENIDTDYYSNIQTFYKPEKWMHMVIKKIQETFDGCDVRDDFLRYFGNEIVSTFVSKNKKFGYNGNQLLLNIIYFEMQLHIDMQACRKKVKSNFKKGKSMKYKELKMIIDEYEVTKSIEAI